MLFPHFTAGRGRGQTARCRKSAPCPALWRSSSAPQYDLDSLTHLLAHSFCESASNSILGEILLKFFSAFGPTGPVSPWMEPGEEVAAPAQSWSLLVYTSALSKGGPRFTDAYEASDVPRDLGVASCVIWESCVAPPSESPVSLTKGAKRARVRDSEQAQTPSAGQGPFA